jgi:ABC-type multidrug transport system fused ATPase/permease subunit
MIKNSGNLVVTKLVCRFWYLLAPRRKKQLALLLILMVGASIAEVVSLGAVLPFLAVLTEPNLVFEYSTLQPVLNWLEIRSSEELLLPITTLFIGVVLIAAGMRLLLLYVSNLLSFGLGADFSQMIYRATLYQPYEVHISRNSSEIISGATTKVNILILQFLVPILQLISSTIILGAVLSVLLVVSFGISVATFFGFGLIYGIVIIATRKHVAEYGQKIAKESVQVIKVLQEGLGGIRDVLIDNTQEVYCQKYGRAEVGLRNAQARSAFIGASPRFIAEACGMAFIAILAYIVTVRESALANVIVLLGVLAMAAQRLLPLLQQAYISIIQIRGSIDCLFDLLELLDSPIKKAPSIANKGSLVFQDAIEIRDLEFRYAQQSKLVLQNINLRIPRGIRMGFVGSTGSGKSTLLDIIMGLLAPTAGGVWIDSVALTTTTRRAWQCRIAHVPQEIYLSDATISENIAFGLPLRKIDLERVKLAAQQAQIAEYIESLPSSYDTFVGERGARLSGGQRQRIGIARALYKQSEVIIFDEATSALDSETEQAVMDTIESLSSDLTILIVAHRLSTLKMCSQIVEIKDGCV